MDHVAFTTTALVGQPLGLPIVRREPATALDGLAAIRVVQLARPQSQGCACRAWATNHQSSPQVSNP